MTNNCIEKLVWNKGIKMSDYPQCGFQKRHKNFFVKHTEESRRKISMALKGKGIGTHLSAEIKNKISLALKGKSKPPRTAEHIRKLALANTGRKQSEETKSKISDSNKKIKKTKEWIAKLSGENHYEWKGEDVGYGALHVWVKKHKGTPDTCEHCGKSGLKGRQIHWANIDHKYHRVLEDFIRLCLQCHKKYDLENNI